MANVIKCFRVRKRLTFFIKPKKRIGNPLMLTGNCSPPPPMLPPPSSFL